MTKNGLIYPLETRKSLINFVIAIFRFSYVVLGALFLTVLLFTPMAATGFDFVLSFVFFLGLGIMFFWMQHTLKRRTVFIRKFILFVHSMAFVGCMVGIFNLFFGHKNYLTDFTREPVYYSSWYIFCFIISLFPVWFFTRPKVKEQFK